MRALALVIAYFFAVFVLASAIMFAVALGIIVGNERSEKGGKNGNSERQDLD